MNKPTGNFCLAVNPLATLFFPSPVNQQPNQVQIHQACLRRVLFLRGLRFFEERESPMSRSSPQSTSQLWPAGKSATRFFRKNRHVFYGHKVMDQLKILARLARPTQPPGHPALQPKNPSRRATARPR